MRVGILGTGHIGTVHARQWSQMAGVSLGYRDRSPDRAGNFRAKFDGIPFESADDLIRWADIIDICLPTDLHVEYGLKVVRANKALFLEKPIASRLEDAVQLVEAASANAIPFMVGNVVRYFPEYELGHQLVKGGQVGTPAAARLRRGGSAPKGNSDWFMDHARSGGVLLDLAIHDFDWLRWTLGEVKFLYSRSVGAEVGHGPDYALSTLTFESGAVAHVESTWMDPSGFRTAYEVAGSGGIVEFDSRSQANLITATQDGSRFEAPLATDDDPYFRELDAFRQAVLFGTEPPITGRDGLMALSISLAALESARTGKVITPARF